MRHRMILEVERTAKGFDVYTDCKRLANQPLFMHRAPPVLALLRRPDCIPIKTTVFIEDGDGVTTQETADGPTIAFCASRDQSVVLIPDYTFLESHGYETLHRWAALNWQDWSARSDTILWRGAAHPRKGLGRISSPEMSPDDLIPRIQLCLRAKGISGTDMKIVVAQWRLSDLDRDRLVHAGLMDERLPVESWVGHKFAVDIDGRTNSFGTMLRRFILGCCVLKVGSAKDYGQWYYDLVKPWVHFVPIRSDMSDLAERIAWCREHDQECRRIAAEGRAFAKSLDGDSEKEAAVQRINLAYTHSA
jgi:hypothetical protein